MAKLYYCDRCGTSENQKDFDRFEIFKSDINGEHIEPHILEFCPQCSVEFREWYRFDWQPKKANRA